MCSEMKLHIITVSLANCNAEEAHTAVRKASESSTPIFSDLDLGPNRLRIPDP